MTIEVSTGLGGRIIFGREVSEGKDHMVYGSTCYKGTYSWTQTNFLLTMYN